MLLTKKQKRVIGKCANLRIFVKDQMLKR